MKKTTGWSVMTSVALVLAAAGVLSCAKPQAQAEAGPGDIVMSSCTVCHPAAKICDALGKKDRDAWNTTVARMVEKGAAVDKASIPEVVDYLAALKPGSPPVCK